MNNTFSIIVCIILKTNLKELIIITQKLLIIVNLFVEVVCMLGVHDVVKVL